jgi:hypothetical protein
MKLGIPIGDASLTTSKDNALLIILEHYTKSSQAPLEHTAFDLKPDGKGIALELYLPVKITLLKLDEV